MEASCSKTADSNLCKNSRKETMEVFLRVRPFKADELENDVNRHCLAIADDQSVLIRPPIDAANANDVTRIHQRFTFSRIFGPEYDQKEFFERSVLPIVKDSLEGETCLIFAYGATNSGKTYTMQGTSSQPGIIPRALAVIFKSLPNSSGNDPSEMKEMASLAFYDGDLHMAQDYPEPLHRKTADNAELFEASEEFLSVAQDSDLLQTLLSESVLEECDDILSVWVSFAEIYNENIYDLLDSSSSGTKRRNLKLAIDKTTISNHIKGLRYVCVGSLSEACRVLRFGCTKLHFADNKLNHHSSRSHCVFSLHMIRSRDKPTVNSLTFCDLAGLERASKTENTGSRLKEAGNINTSLLVLGRCIEALREKRVVPYRDSKLTRLFQGYFTEHGKASMIVNVSQSSEMFNDTLHVLKFSASAQQVVSINNFEYRLVCPHQRTSDRLAELWPAARQRLSLLARSRLPSNSEESYRSAESSLSTETSVQEQGNLQEIIDFIWELERKIQEITREKNSMEFEIRSEVCEEFQKMMLEKEQMYEERLKKSEEQCETLRDQRFALQIALSKMEETQSDDGDTTLDTTEDASRIDENLDKSNSVLNSQDYLILKEERDALLLEKRLLIGQRDSLASNLQKEQLEATVLRQRCAELEQEKDNICKESKALNHHNEQLLKDLSSLSKEVSSLTRKNEILAKDKSNLQQEMLVLNKAYESLQERDAMRLRMSKEAAFREKLEEDLSLLQKEKETMEKKLEDQITSLAKENKTLSRCNNDLKKDMDAFLESYDSLLRDMDDLKEQQEKKDQAHKKEVSNMNKNMTSVQAKFEKLLVQNAELEEENKKLRTEMAAQQMELNAPAANNVKGPTKKTLPKRTLRRLECEEQAKAPESPIAHRLRNKK